MPAFVDIHSHVLWGLDDGARDLEMSIEMLRIAADSGTTDIVATPHSDFQFPFDPGLVDHRCQQLAEHPGPKPRIHTGCDFHLHFDNINDCLENPTKYTINHLRYLLVEFSNSNIPKSIGKVFDRMLGAAITPVITHPERNALLMKDPALLVSWIHAGCLIQVTAQSFLSQFGKLARNSADELMSRGLVHFIASDGHDPVHRPPDLSAAFDTIAQQYGTATATNLFVAHPKATLTGDLLEVEMPHAPVSRKKWLFF